jgi:hypothetical protein
MSELAGAVLHSTYSRYNTDSMKIASSYLKCQVFISYIEKVPGLVDSSIGQGCYPHDEPVTSGWDPKIHTNNPQ